MNTLQKALINSNLSFQKYTSQEFDNLDLSRSLLNGTMFKESRLLNCNLQNSDLEGCIVDNVVVKKCVFNSCDIKSIVITNSEIEEVSFTSATILNCKFLNVKFDRCIFSSTFMQENTFEKCQFDNIEFDHCSALLNDFKSSLFISSTIKNNFYYSIFGNCKFEKSTLEAYLLGYSYGLTKENCKDLSYLLNGCMVDMQLENILQSVEIMYTDRQMFLNIGLLNLNLNLAENDYAFCLFIKFINLCIGKNIIIKSELMKFLCNLLNLLYEKNEISPYTVVYLYSALSKIMSDNKTSNSEYIFFNELNLLKNNLYFIYQEFISQIENGYHHIEGTKEIELHVVYDKKPDVNLVDLLNSAKQCDTMATLIRTKKGSFYEWIICNEQLIPCLSILLEFLGIVIPIAYSKRVENKKNNAKEEGSNKMIIRSEGTDIEIILPEQKNVAITTSKLKTVIEVIDKFELSPKNNFKGYNKKNVRKIEINY